ncbi:hypothetical protein [Conexibacter sp. CPCC 206217]|uniref:hypothetical protein n=1 Tax=Conexibacter sp. CPCC 206217 TaxID=3064574 RepID=UPI0027175B88|nr:hypothetical protein [Conexibacter sp. CPCC 206217]MDO8214102.1 hypothetical protein [Conexibacter sp. CPCC 206217]
MRFVVMVERRPRPTAAPPQAGQGSGAIGDQRERLAGEAGGTVNGDASADDNSVVDVQLTVANSTVTEPGPARTLTGIHNEQADPAATIDECLDVSGNGNDRPSASTSAATS